MIRINEARRVVAVRVQLFQRKFHLSNGVTCNLVRSAREVMHSLSLKIHAATTRRNGNLHPRGLQIKYYVITGQKKVPD